MELRKQNKKVLAKEMIKGMVEKSHQKKLDTIEDHQNKSTIEDQCCSWATTLKLVFLF